MPVFEVRTSLSSEFRPETGESRKACDTVTRRGTTYTHTHMCTRCQVYIIQKTNHEHRTVLVRHISTPCWTWSIVPTLVAMALGAWAVNWHQWTSKSSARVETKSSAQFMMCARAKSLKYRSEWSELLLPDQQPFFFCACTHTHTCPGIQSRLAFREFCAAYFTDLRIELKWTWYAHGWKQQNVTSIYTSIYIGHVCNTWHHMTILPLPNDITWYRCRSVQ